VFDALGSDVDQRWHRDVPAAGHYLWEGSPEPFAMDVIALVDAL